MFKKDTKIGGKKLIHWKEKGFQQGERGKGDKVIWAAKANIHYSYIYIYE